MFDKEGFLTELSLWNVTIAQNIATKENIELTPPHWELIYSARKFYELYDISPEMRPLVKWVGKECGAEKGKSIYLLRLFPNSPAKLISKIAGLPNHLTVFNIMTTLINEHPFAQYIRILGKGKTGSRSLTQQEAYDAFTAILNNQVEEVQLGAFLMLLRVKEESAEEIAGFVQACKDYIEPPKSILAHIDWSSYAGKRKHLPWFIACLLLLAENGQRIFIHGAQGHTAGRLYTEDVFQELALPIAKNWEDVKSQLDQSNISFMPISSMCKPLFRMIEMRSLFGLRSPIHTLCRLINPLQCDYSFQSIFHPAYADTHQIASHLLGQKNMAVFKGEGGEIERKADATCLVKSIINNEVSEEKWPRLLEGRQEPLEGLEVEYFKQVWRGEVIDSYAENAITGTLAIVLKSINHLENFDVAQEHANQLWQKRKKSKFA